MKAQRKLITKAEAKPTKVQHTTPCSDCPFARKSLKGWLGGHEPEFFVRLAHGENTYECHTKIGPQCAGLAIFRANIHKSPRNREALVLKRDEVKVFSWDNEFLEHHNG